MSTVKTAAVTGGVVFAVALQLAHFRLPPRADAASPVVALGRAPDPVPPAIGVRTAPAATGGYRSEVIAPDPLGQYHVTLEVEGYRFPAIVDTGATFVSLTAEDAGRLGLRPASADFKYQAQTANGVTRIASAVLPEVRLGSLAVRHVQAMILPPGALATSLLGMSFLSKLGGVQVVDRQLMLRE